MPTAATYARVSTDRQRDGISLEEQEARMLAYAEGAGLSVPEEYRFREAASGLKSIRDEYTKVQQLIAAGAIDALIVYSSDRHTRDAIHGKVFRAELRRSRAQLHFVTEGGEVDIFSAQGEFLSTLRDAFNQYWLQRILETTLTKKRYYIEQGVPFVQGRVPYGYRRIGKQREARAVIFEEEAEVVRNIFRWADEGLSIYAITKLLRGTPAPGESRESDPRRRAPGQWGQASAYRILRHEVYAGTDYARRYERIDGRKVERPRELWVPIAVPPIVDRDLWERVQRRLDEGRSMREKPHAKYDYLLARRMRCGVCGYAFSTYPVHDNGRVLLYYRCSTQALRKEAKIIHCGAPRFRADKADAAVWAAMVELLRDPQSMELTIAQEQERRQSAAVQQADHSALISKLIEEHLSELKGIAQELGRTEPQSYLAAALRERASDLERDIERLKQEQQREHRQQVTALPDIDWLRALSAQMGPVLDVADFTLRRRMIDILDWRFTLVCEDIEQRILIHWLGLTIQVTL